MKFSKYVSLYLTIFAACGFLPLTALDVGSQFNLSGGYSNDVIAAHNTITEVSGVETVDHFRVDNLNIGKIGFDFRLSPWKMDVCCDYPFLGNLYVDGYAYWGWSGKDDFERAISTTTAGGAVLSSTISHGDQQARTQDFEIGLGYLVFNCEEWALGVTGGYSYNMQRVRTSNGETAISAGAFASDPLYSGLVFKQKWQGAWVGSDFFYNCCDWLINVGYEYHFANYRASFNIPSDPIAQASDFSDVRKGHHGYGNVVYASIHQPVCDCVDLGLSFTYKNFRTRHCGLKPKHSTFVAEGYPEGTTGSATSKWINYSIIADLGYSF